MTIRTASPRRPVLVNRRRIDRCTLRGSERVLQGTITVDHSQTIYAFADASGYAQSPIISAAFTISLPLAANPNISPGNGSYTSPQSVTITDTTPAATIYYTTDGSTPTTGSALYSKPISVSQPMTINAMAVAYGYRNSNVATASYTFQAATPAFSVPNGIYTSAQTVAITDASPGAVIYYTTDGSIPGPFSTQYSGPLIISQTETLQAMASGTGYTPSSTASATYTITPPAATPALSVPGGTYASAQSVSISDATHAAIIYYTIDGTAPTLMSSQYSGPITISQSTTLQAMASGSGYSNSRVAAATYIIGPPAAPPTFSLASGTYTSAQTVTITDATPNATIYYTTDGSVPGISSTPYSSPIAVSSTETINAIATASGYSASTITSATYTVNVPPPNFTFVAPPSPLTVAAGGTATTTLTVTPQNGFSSAVTFACSTLPAGLTCSFDPATVTPSSNAATTQLTISASASALNATPARRPFVPGAMLALAGCLLFWRKRRSIAWRGCVLLLSATLVGASACGGSSGTKPLPPTTASVTITASSGSLAQTVTIGLTINH